MTRVEMEHVQVGRDPGLATMTSSIQTTGRWWENTVQTSPILKTKSKLVNKNANSVVVNQKAQMDSAIFGNIYI